MIMAEVKMVGDVVLRWVSGEYSGPMLPNYDLININNLKNFGIVRLDHAVHNVPDLMETVEYLTGGKLKYNFEKNCVFIVVIIGSCASVFLSYK